MRLMSALALAVLAVSPTALLADTYVYTYTGQDYPYLYTSGGESQAYTTSDFVSVEFTLAAPLPDGITVPVLDVSNITPISFSFFDGVNTITNLTPGLSKSIFAFATDASGEITGWEAYADDANTNVISTEWVPLFDHEEDDGLDDYQNGAYSSAQSPYRAGTWTVTDVPSPAPTPEPASLMLVGTGLVGIFGFARRKIRAV